VTLEPGLEAGTEGGTPGGPDSSAPSDASDPSHSSDASGRAARRTRRATVAAQFERLVSAIRTGDEDSVEGLVVALSQRNRLLAPLALVVGAFVMLFQGVKLLVTNWRLTLVQILPAMWIWAAMVDLKAHVFRGKHFHPLYGPLLIPIILAIATITALSFFLNAVFAFSIAKPGTPEIRPAFREAFGHRRTVLAWGFATGLALGFATMVTNRWGVRWFALVLGIVVAVMMVEYVAVPARLIGAPTHSRRDQLTASAVGGAVGAVICSPPYALGRVALLLLGSSTFRVLAILLLAIAVVLQTGATSAVKAVKLSAKLVTGKIGDEVPAGSPALAAEGMDGSRLVAGTGSAAGPPVVGDLSD
jgi:hypothetical protein